ncbi:MAG: 2-C-methyl-D-erythritol 4-phosphate cytidylyltransferase, partial [Deltaproteobacteria bacterium]|nr:2-C-methyl-D-erythritol 4-phosphate cytidylyltransferase [Deltaproteobacteria bacterium]
TIQAFEDCPLIDSIIAVAPQGDELTVLEDIVRPGGFIKILRIIAGGNVRQDSVGKALKEIEGRGFDVIIVHDGARPLVSRKAIEETLREASSSGAAVCAVPVKETIKEAEGGFVKRTVPRATLWSVQTPQAFKAGVLIEAFKKAEEDGFIGTDESSLVERAGFKVRVVEGSYENIKITTPEDMDIAECILKRRAGAR